MKTDNRELKIFTLLIVSISIGFILIKENKSSLRNDKIILACPYGHLSVVKIPIVYGLLRMDSVILEKIKNKEFIPGGCVVSENSPSYKIICSKCDYELVNIKNKDIWQKTSKDKNSYIIPLSKIILSFPLTRLDSSEIGFLKYTQEFYNHQVITEQIKFTSRCLHTEMKSIISDFCNLNLINIIGTDSSEGLFNFIGFNNNKEYDFQTSNYWDGSLIVVSFSWKSKNAINN